MMVLRNPSHEVGGGGGSPLLTSLVAYWKLDEASGSRADSVGSKHLTPVNAPGGASGKVGTATSFVRTSNQYLVCTDSPLLRGGTFTIATWVYPGGPIATLHEIVQKGPTDEYGLEVKDAKGNFYIHVGGGVYPEVPATSFGDLSANTWYLLIAWCDNTAKTLNICINNGSVDTVSFTGNPVASGGNFYIGAYQGDPDGIMDGRIDEFGFWRRILTADERTALYNGGAGVTHPFS